MLQNLGKNSFGDAFRANLILWKYKNSVFSGN